MMRVTQPRQAEILKDMRKIGDFSPIFCRTLAIQTPDELRNKNKQQQKAWVDDDGRKRGMVERLKHAEQQHEFYASLYGKYSGDLLKLAFYVRKMLTIPSIETYLQANHAEILTRCKSVIDGAA